MLDPTTLDVREVTNLVLVVFGLTMTALFVSFLFQRWKESGVSIISFRKRRADRTAQAAVGFAILTFGELLRAAVIWEMLHFERMESNYLTRAPILIIALMLIIAGSACIIRVFTPEDLGHWVWIAALTVSVVLSYFAVAVF